MLTMPLQVVVHHVVPLGFGHAFDGGVVGDAGVVDEDVQVAEVFQHLGHKLLAVVQMGDVDGISFGLDAEVGQFFFDGNHVFVAAAPAKSDVTALLGETEGNGATDAACGTGYNGYFVF